MVWVKHTCQECGHTKKVNRRKPDPKWQALCIKPGCQICPTASPLNEHGGYAVLKKEGENAFGHDPINYPYRGDK